MVQQVGFSHLFWNLWFEISLCNNHVLNLMNSWRTSLPQKSEASALLLIKEIQIAKQKMLCNWLGEIQQQIQVNLSKINGTHAGQFLNIYCSIKIALTVSKRLEAWKLKHFFPCKAHPLQGAYSKGGITPTSRPKCKIGLHSDLWIDNDSIHCWSTLINDDTHS